MTVLTKFLNVSYTSMTELVLQVYKSILDLKMNRVQNRFITKNGKK